MLVQNEKLATLLKEKGQLVEEGRKSAQELEDLAEPIVVKDLVSFGLKAGDKDANTNVVFSGTYNELVKAFSAGAMSKRGEVIEAELKDQIEAQKAKEMMLAKYNENATKIVNEEILPTLNLGEFEQITNIDLKEDGIEISKIDVVENFKQRYLENKNK